MGELSGAKGWILEAKTELLTMILAWVHSDAHGHSDRKGKICILISTSVILPLKALLKKFIVSKRTDATLSVHKLTPHPCFRSEAESRGEGRLIQRN